MTDSASLKLKGFIQLGFVIGFIVASFAISGLLQSQKPNVENKDQEERTLFVETATVKKSTHRIRFTTTGIVEARTDIDIVPQVSGRVINVNEEFFEGGQFENGEVLFEIDPRDFELEVERLEAEVARAQTSLTLEQAESEAALEEWAQFNGDKPVPDLVARKPQMAEVRANLRAAKAQLSNAKLDLERTRFTFPFQGRVLSSMVAEGRFLASGQPYGTVFDVGTLEIQASLEDQQLEWLLDDERANIKISVSHMGRQTRYDGFLKRGTSALDPGTRFASVNFGIVGTQAEEDKTHLLPGIFATLSIEGPELQNVSSIPATALQKENIVWGIDKNNRLVQYTPEIIYMSDTYAVVRGLPESVRAVTSRLEGGAAGMRVMYDNGSEDKYEGQKEGRQHNQQHFEPDENQVKKAEYQGLTEHAQAMGREKPTLFLGFRNIPPPLEGPEHPDLTEPFESAAQESF